MPGGDAFEYTGTGLEKFLGFLIALVILAFYLGIFQVVLTFVGFSLLGVLVGYASSPTDAALQLSGIYLAFLALAPLALLRNMVPVDMCCRAPGGGACALQWAKRLGVMCGAGWSFMGRLW